MADGPVWHVFHLISFWFRVSLFIRRTRQLGGKLIAAALN